MALESPIKKEIDKATRDLESLQRLYNVYFQGGEEDPPRQERRALDSTLAKIKSQLPMISNAADRFQANALLNRYNSLAARWDKTLRGIEEGSIPRPKKRE